ncbi:diversity-generating retroelement protein Avd [candidate division KSB1 bacterium]|nr:MAG: diversity-generating retroelement protein Avd [candidate division KSB1 bacterium]
MVIFKKAYGFCKWLMNHTEKFPKSHRFSVAVKMENCMLDFLRYITIANYRTKKYTLLKSADEELVTLRILLRLSCDMKFLSLSSYEFGIKSIEELGRLLGGWIKSEGG